MSLNLKKRIKKLEDEREMGSVKVHWCTICKLARQSDYINKDFIPKSLTKECCREMAIKNIDAVKKNRIARAEGCEIEKWVIQIF